MMKLEHLRAMIRPYIAVTALLLAACSSTTDTTRSAANISALSGSAQVGFIGSALPQPLVVQVTASDGTAVSGQTVDFTVQSGTATVNPASATTDATGKAQTVVSAGANAGTVVIVATVHATSLNAIFTATIQAGADASCTGVTPMALAVGDVHASVTGSSICLTNTTAAEYLVHVFFGTSVQSAQTQVTLTGSGITTASATVPATAAVMNASGLTALRATSPRIAAVRTTDPARQLDMRLRQMERTILAPRMAAARRAMQQRRALRSAAPPTVGQILSLNVDEDCDKTANPNIRPGRVVAVTNSAIVVADTTNPAGGFTDADYAAIGATFDTLVNPLDTAAFGAPTDIDGNGRIILFYTNAVNALTTNPSQGLIEGFFNPRDLFPTTTTVIAPGDTLEHCTASNYGEMFYVIVPDPSGTINHDTLSKAVVQQLTIDVTVHEYQHLINAARRLYINNANDFEEVWLNEGLSHIAEELLYYHAAGFAPRENLNGTSVVSSQKAVDAFNNYQGSNAGRYDVFLGQPTTNSPYADNDSLGTRGATWNFLRYAADHQGTSDGTVWRQIDNSTTTGFQNLTNVFASGGTIATILNEFRDWSISVYTDDLVTTTTPYQELSWNMRDLYPTAFRSPFPLVISPLLNVTPRTLTIIAGGSFYAKIGVAAGATASASWTTNSNAVQISIVRTK